jgi:DNA-binding MarR family transcriptional regulator
MLEGFDKAFENRIRLGMMSILMVNEWVEFTELKDLLQVTDGNLASHVTYLEKVEYIETRKSFIGKKPNTTFRATKTGKDAFKQHLKALEKLIKKK